MCSIETHHLLTSNEDVSKQKSAYYLFLFRHGFHGFRGKGIKKIREIRVIRVIRA